MAQSCVISTEESSRRSNVCSSHVLSNTPQLVSLPCLYFVGCMMKVVLEIIHLVVSYLNIIQVVLNTLQNVFELLTLCTSFVVRVIAGSVVGIVFVVIESIRAAVISH